MKKQITVGISVIAYVALCAAVWPRSAEVGDLPAEPEKAAVSAEIEAWSEERPRILLSADTHAPAPETETVAESEPSITEITEEEEKTETVPPTVPASLTASKSTPASDEPKAR